MAPIYTEFAISLSVRKEKTSLPAIRVETALDGLPLFSSDYPRGRVWQSAVWPEELREAQHVSVIIELGSQCATRDRIAMNHTFAGLINFLDVASKVTSLRNPAPRRPPLHNNTTPRDHPTSRHLGPMPSGRRHQTRRHLSRADRRCCAS
jgi:hypothetical protein